jgi:hypothetical protein
MAEWEADQQPHGGHQALGGGKGERQAQTRAPRHGRDAKDRGQRERVQPERQDEKHKADDEVCGHNRSNCVGARHSCEGAIAGGAIAGGAIAGGAIAGGAIAGGAIAGGAIAGGGLRRGTRELAVGLSRFPSLTASWPKAVPPSAQRPKRQRVAP